MLNLLSALCAVGAISVFDNWCTIYTIQRSRLDTYQSECFRFHPKYYTTPVLDSVTCALVSSLFYLKHLQVFKLVGVEVKLFLPGEVEQLVDFVSVLLLHGLLEGHLLFVEAMVDGRVINRGLAAVSSKQGDYTDDLYPWEQRRRQTASYLWNARSSV